MELKLFALISVVFNIGLTALVMYLFKIIDTRTDQARYVADLYTEQRAKLEKYSEEIEALHSRSQFRVEDTDD